MNSETISKLEAKAADTSLPPEERVALYEKIASLRERRDRDARRELIRMRADEETARQGAAQSGEDNLIREIVVNLTAIFLGVFVVIILPIIVFKFAYWLLHL